MPLNKTKLMKMIEKRKKLIINNRQRLSLTKETFMEQNKEFLQNKTEDYLNKSYEVFLCSIDTGIYNKETEIALLTEILNKYYQPKQRKPRKPSKFEQAKERLQQLEKQYNEGSIIIKTDIQWEIDNLRSFISGIEQMERAEKALKEEQEIVE